MKPHKDSNSNWSIAIGYGYDLLKNSVATIKSDLASINVTLSPSDETLLNDYHAGKKTKDEVLNGLTLTLPSEPAATTLLQLKLTKYETALDIALGGHSQLMDSKERIAVLSLLYTMVDPVADKISKKIKSTIAAIQNDNRAEAWFEIRYGSNADKQHASRRYAEAHLFGLYDVGATFTDPNEAKEVIRMYTWNKKAILAYEAKYPPANADYADILTDIKDARDYLIANFATNVGMSIDGEVMVGAGLSSYAYLEENRIMDELTGTDKNDLIFGEKGSDIMLSGGKGNDVIYGGEGNDKTTGGKGNDYIEGGAGNDIYYINTGDGTDTIEDKEGDNRVIVNGKEIKLLLKQPDGSYKNPDGKIKATIEGTDLVIYDAVTNAKIAILNENFESGDFGINLLDTPSNPVTTNTTIGDLTPHDFDPDAGGIQSRNDDWGNIITDASNPSPNRKDTLYDTTGNDRIEAGGGDDTIYAKRGGDDWILGGVIKRQLFGREVFACVGN
ncbi:MAG: hypothetical protein HY035_00820 [Nitrospirae bacterium]|nr:hypothetical protein [Nitrospirota bacterium]